METMFLPLHILSPSGFGDVAIPNRESGGIPFKPTTTNVPTDFKDVILNINNCGTGFLVAVSDIRINGAAEKFGLILTAAHTIIDLVNFGPQTQTFKCELRGEKQRAFFLKEFASSTTVDNFCSTTNSFYCMPGDVSILLITLHHCIAPEYFEPLEQSLIKADMPCYVSGFPQQPKNLNYCIPNKNYSREQLAILADDIFCKFTGLIFSHGIVINENETFVEISCSTTSGMSGSPIISQGKYIGLYVGGPVLPGQKELVDSMKLVIAGEYAQAISVLKSTVCYNSYYDFDIFSRYLESSHVKFIELYAKYKSNAELSDLDKINVVLLIEDNDSRDDQIEGFLLTCNEIVSYPINTTYVISKLGEKYPNSSSTLLSSMS